MEKFEQWYRNEKLDADLRKQMDQMSDTEKRDAFYTELQFGTAGMRGLLGPGPNRMNIYTIRKANVGFAKYIASYGEEAKKRGVAIAYDNRYMSKEFASESARILASFGITSYLFDTLRPTPELSFAVRELNCYGGIVITASHNPKEYNGYKVYDETGCQLVPELIEQVIGYVNEVTDELAIEVQLTEEQEELIHLIGEEIDQKYYQKVLGIQLNSNQDKTGFKIVFTPQHGTSNEAVKSVLPTAGYELIPVKEQCDPDPAFSNTVTPNPEEKAAYNLAIDYMKKYDAPIAIATDPDADRVGVVNYHDGEYHLLTGNQTGSILIEYIFSQMKNQNKMPKRPVMFNTVVTSDLGEVVAKNYNVETEKTLTGFKFIGNKIAHYEQTKEKDFVFGYEESYGYLVQPFVRDKDAIQACLIIAEAACYYHNLGKTLVDVLNELYDTYGYYNETQSSITLAGEAGANKIKEIIKELREIMLEEIAGIKVIRKEDYGISKAIEHGKESILDFPKSDVIKYYLEDGSWIAVRPSGTEPKCKFYYCIRGNTQQEAIEKTEQLKQAMNQFAE